MINHQGFVAGLVVNTVLGGTDAVAGGGKFANGAITGAFGYLFDAMGRSAMHSLFNLVGSEFSNELRGHHNFAGRLAVQYDDYLTPDEFVNEARALPEVQNL
jgi:hypothetical protein